MRATVHQVTPTPLATVAVPIADLALYHKNPRHGDIGAISESLRVLGQYRTIAVNVGTLTGRPNEVLAGNHTVQAAEALGWTTIQVGYVDVDDETAARIVLADNRTNDLATYDDPALINMLEELVGSAAGLEATGYDTDDLDDLLRVLGDPATLDDLEARYGTSSDREMWPVVSVKVPRDVYEKWVGLVMENDGDDSTTFGELVAAAT